jgi:hypothetical protein
MKFVIKHPTANRFLRKPRFVGDTVHWTEPNGKPLSTQEPWLFATRSGADKARDMHALEASVEAWYEAGDTAQAEPSRLSPSNMQWWQQCPPSAVIPTPAYSSGMGDFALGLVLGELIVDSSSDCSGF